MVLTFVTNNPKQIKTFKDEEVFNQIELTWSGCAQNRKMKLKNKQGEG